MSYLASLDKEIFEHDVRNLHGPIRVSASSSSFVWDLEPDANSHHSSARALLLDPWFETVQYVQVCLTF